jgi:hypothetical protein
MWEIVIEEKVMQKIEKDTGLGTGHFFSKTKKVNT